MCVPNLPEVIGKYPDDLVYPAFIDSRPMCLLDKVHARLLLGIRRADHELPHEDVHGYHGVRDVPAVYSIIVVSICNGSEEGERLGESGRFPCRGRFASLLFEMVRIDAQIELR